MKRKYNLNEIMEVIDKCLANPVYKIERGLFKKETIHIPSLRANIFMKLKGGWRWYG